MPQSTDLSDLVRQYSGEVNSRIETLTADAAAGGFDAAIDLMVNAIEAGGVIQAFGTGHSEAFAMEIAGRAGGLIPTNKIALRDVVLRGNRDLGDLTGSELERSPSVV
ncbi:MAG TPA: SIS domain-containing protein, partial [Terrimesophilobacter sp.]|nr:SIS domain-containing protein [Terrimesophilobacter sp.]